MLRVTDKEGKLCNTTATRALFLFLKREKKEIPEIIGELGWFCNGKIGKLSLVKKGLFTAILGNSAVKYTGTINITKKSVGK